MFDSIKIYFYLSSLRALFCLPNLSRVGDETHQMLMVCHRSNVIGMES
jgi:hypothetical protein